MVAPKGDTARAVPVTSDEDRLLRSAFGRFGGHVDARAAAAAVVARYQQLGAGQWFLCGCLPGAERPPALVPVSQTHIRRHEDARWPVHCQTCDFYREPDEQRAVTASYQARAAAGPWQLAKPFGRAAEALDRRIGTISHHAKRPAIARLLMQLVTDAGLQRMAPDWRQPFLVDQVKAIWSAARSIEIAPGVALPEFLRTSPAKLDELVAKIAAAKPGRFKGSRPHGVLIVRAASIGRGVLHPVSGDPIPVRGRLAVFGEDAEARPGVAAERAARAARAPYLTACVVGRAEEGGPVEVLSAYAHPCAADAHLMLVDSDMERGSLAQLRSVQHWLGRNRGVAVTIEKPVFDIGPDDLPDAVPRPPCIPDFVMRAVGPDRAGRTVVGETMGFAQEAYRDRKERSHAAMSAALGRAPVVAHDFHLPRGEAQDVRDNRFWREMRWVLAGP